MHCGDKCGQQSTFCQSCQSVHSKNLIYAFELVHHLSFSSWQRCMLYLYSLQLMAVVNMLQYLRRGSTLYSKYALGLKWAHHFCSFFCHSILCLKLTSKCLWWRVTTQLTRVLERRWGNSLEFLIKLASQCAHSLDVSKSFNWKVPIFPECFEIYC